LILQASPVSLSATPLRFRHAFDAFATTPLMHPFLLSPYYYAAFAIYAISLPLLLPVLLFFAFRFIIFVAPFRLCLHAFLPCLMPLPAAVSYQLPLYAYYARLAPFFIGLYGHACYVFRFRIFDSFARVFFHTPIFVDISSATRASATSFFSIFFMIFAFAAAC